jgi:hypothetical protein
VVKAFPIALVLFACPARAPPVSVPAPAAPPGEAAPTVPAEPMSAETARHRMAAALAADQPGPEQLGQLIEVAERSDDPAISAAAAYDAGTLALRLGDERASSLLAQADRTAMNPALRARARFNLGHAAMPPEPDQPATDLDAIDARLAGLREAAKRFRSVLEVEPGHREAAANTERVRRMIRDLEQQRRQVEDRQRAMEELAEQLERLADQQSSQAERSRQRAERGERGGEQAAEQQETLSEQTDAAAEQAAQQAGDGAPREQLESAQEAQQRAAAALERGDEEGAAEAQQEAADALRRAAEQARRRSGGGQGGGDADEAQPDQSPPDAEQTRQDGAERGDAEGDAGVRIDPIAEALLDKERREREQRGQYLQRGRRQQVERDW